MIFACTDPACRFMAEGESGEFGLNTEREGRVNHGSNDNRGAVSDTPPTTRVNQCNRNNHSGSRKYPSGGIGGIWSV